MARTLARSLAVTTPACGAFGASVRGSPRPSALKQICWKCFFEIPGDMYMCLSVLVGSDWPLLVAHVQPITRVSVSCGHTIQPEYRVILVRLLLEVGRVMGSTYKGWSIKSRGTYISLHAFLNVTGKEKVRTAIQVCGYHLMPEKRGRVCFTLHARVKSKESRDPLARRD